MAQRTILSRAPPGKKVGSSTGHWNCLAMSRHHNPSPTLGRFIERAPIGFEAGEEKWYRFVANGPTGRTDPRGLQNSATEGRAENGYYGSGEWTFQTPEEFYEWLLRTQEWNPAGQFPDDWKQSGYMGCIGLQRIRLGVPNDQMAQLTNALAMYSAEAVARDEIAKLKTMHPEKTHVLTFLELPAITRFRVDKYQREFAGRVFALQDLIGSVDLSRMADFNFGVHPGLPWVGAARAPSPDDRCGLPGLRSLEAACASASMPALVSHAGSRGTGTPPRSSHPRSCRKDQFWDLIPSGDGGFWEYMNHGFAAAQEHGTPWKAKHITETKEMERRGDWIRIFAIYEVAKR